MKYLFFFLAAYFLGSIPVGFLLVQKLKGIDIRQHGSGNIGATNVFRVAGKQVGIFVFALDALKGTAAVLLPVLVGYPAWDPPANLGLGIAAILGHTFPIWLRFKGGKGVATSLGVFLGISWKATVITFAAWVIFFLLFRIISLASLAAAILFPFVIFFTHGIGWLFGVSLLLTLFIFYTHRGNLARLHRGEEKRLF